MLFLKRLYSEDGYFREIPFERGINLIIGDKSKSQSKVLSKKQNGVGKSLSIDLIDFCFLSKKTDTNRVFLINDKDLPREAFVSLHFEFKDQQYVISRNKKDEILLKVDNSPIEKLSYGDATKRLSNILGLGSDKPNARQMLQFFIKREEYSYKSPVKLFRANYCDLLAPHFYMLNLPLDDLVAVKEAFNDNAIGLGLKQESAKFLRSQGLDINKLKLQKSELDGKIEATERSLEYQNFSQVNAEAIEKLKGCEEELDSLRRRRSLLVAELRELKSLLNIFSDDIYINDDELKKIYDNYLPGLGTLVKNDFDSLMRFRDQIVAFKNDVISDKRQALEKELERVNDALKIADARVTRLQQALSSNASNELIRSFRSYKAQLKDFEDYSRALTNNEEGEDYVEGSKKAFSDAVASIQAAIKATAQLKQSLIDTFREIYEYVMGDSAVSFDYAAKNTFKAESFFKIDIFMDDTGSGGSDQRRAALYDIALLRNEYTRPRTLGLVIHDNLIFGRVDKDSSIKILNYINSMPTDEFQYIATANTDDYEYAELKDDFDFRVEDKKRITLTKNEPLFKRVSSDFLKRSL